MGDNNTNNENDKLLNDNVITQKISKQRHYQDPDRLSTQQANFVLNYMRTAQLEGAVILAGYKSTNAVETGKKLLATPKVQRALTSYQIQVNRSDIVTFEDKLKVLRGHLYCSDKEISIRAASELNKMQGHYAPTKNVNLNLDLTIEAFDQLGIDVEDF